MAVMANRKWEIWNHLWRGNFIAWKISYDISILNLTVAKCAPNRLWLLASGLRCYYQLKDNWLKLVHQIITATAFTMHARRRNRQSGCFLSMFHMPEILSSSSFLLKRCKWHMNKMLKMISLSVPYRFHPNCCHLFNWIALSETHCQD